MSNADLTGSRLGAVRGRVIRTVCFAAAIGCRGAEPAVTVDAAPQPVDAPAGPDGVGCTTMTPRTAPLETFVGPTGLETRLGTLIDGAQTSLDVQMYLFTVTSLANKLVAAHQRGVAVRVILDPDEAGNVTVRSKLQAAGVATRDASRIYMFSHAKYVIVDGTSATIMSMNFNLGAMQNERNYGFVDRDLEDVTDVHAIFEMDWAAAAGASAPVADLACTRLIVSPNNSKQRLLQLVNSATATLEIEALYMTEGTMQNAVLAAKARGVAVRVILENPSDQAENTATQTLFANAGIPVKFVASQFYLHAKLIVADGVAFVGSENFSFTSLTQNREVGELVFEPASEAIIQQQFEADWTAVQ